MVTPTTTARVPGQRIDSLDVLRGFAVCGMLLINISMMGKSVWDIFSGPQDSWSTAEYAQYWVRELFFEGTSRAMFSILFGASFMLLVARAMEPTDPVGPVDIYYRRCVWMFVFGVIHATLLLWPGDILVHYALPAMALFAFRRADPRLLLALAAVFMIVLNFMEAASDLKEARVYNEARPALAKQLAGQSLTASEEAAIEAFAEAKAQKSSAGDDYQAEVTARQGYLTSLAFQTGIWIQWFDFDAFGWGLEAFTFMLIGIALFKLGVLTGKRSLRFYLVFGVVSMAVGLLVNGHETWLKITTDDAPGLWLDEMTYQHGRLAMCLGYICLFIVVLHSALGRVLLAPFRHIGRMAMSNYIGHSIIAAILFTGFGLFGTLNNLELWGVAVFVWVFQAIFSWYWLRHFTMGPLEWVWRCLTYWKPQPLRRGAAIAAGAPAQ